MEYINWIMENKVTIFSVATSVVGVAAVVATLTPTDADNKIIAKISAVIHFLAANFGKAKNK